jgi:glucokinase
VRLARRRLEAGEKSSLSGKERITSEAVFKAADAGDPVGSAVRQEVIESIGIGLGSLLNIFDPEALVVGGGVAQGLEGQWDQVEDAVRRHSLAHYQQNLPLFLTTLGEDVSLLGAAALAFRAQ